MLKRYNITSEFIFNVIFKYPSNSHANQSEVCGSLQQVKNYSPIKLQMLSNGRANISLWFDEIIERDDLFFPIKFEVDAVVLALSLFKILSRKGSF